MGIRRVILTPASSSLEILSGLLLSKAMDWICSCSTFFLGIVNS